MTQAVTLAALWALYGWAHSWLAGARAKAQWQRFGYAPARYRLVYNGFAFASLVPIAVYYGINHWPALPLALTLGNWSDFALRGLGLGLAIVAMRSYRGSDFVGWEAWQSKREPALEPLQTGGLHQLVRHPLYFALLLMIWPGCQHWGQLINAAAITTYLVFGSRNEESKLRDLYPGYQAYQESVPALVPTLGSLRRWWAQRAK